MGSGYWSTDVYSAAATYRAVRGMSAFDYSDHNHRRSSTEWAAHPTLDPLGVTSRESRDSDEHPTSLAISVLFDVTGSMGQVPVVLQTKLPQLLGLLVRKGYVAHPQVLFGAIGDATCDRVPLQIGQFESDNRMDNDLGNLFLEGGGGGQMTESYELALYFMARHTALDCYEKRGRRGYLFVIGDEMAYSVLKASHVRGIIGDHLADDLTLAQVVAEVQQRFDLYFIIPEGSSYARDPRIVDFWRRHLGQNVIILDDLDAVCETIALTIGLGEGIVDLAAGLADLRDLDEAEAADTGNAYQTGAAARDTTVATVSKALARWSGRRGVVATGSLPASPSGWRGAGSGVVRM